MKKKPLTLALTKGRILRETLPLLAAAGIEPLEDIASSRRLVFPTSHEGLQLLVMRGVDVPVYVRHGAADAGVVGKDTLLEQGAEGLYEPLDLRIAEGIACGIPLIDVLPEYVSHFRSLYAQIVQIAAQDQC